MDFLKYNIIATILLLTLGCSKDKNTVVTRTIPLNTFTHVALNSPFDVQLTKDSTSSIQITAANRFVNSVIYEVVGDTLFLSCNTKKRWLYPGNNAILIDIHYTTIREVIANETCDIKTTSPLQTDKFNLILKNKANAANLILATNEFTYWNNVPCGGELKLSGSTNTMAIWNYALMKVDARHLNCVNALIENNATGDCIANISGELKYGITNSGNIRLTKNPNAIIKEFDTGSGEVIIE